MATMRKISSETTTLQGLEITLTVYRDPDGNEEDRALLHLEIGNGAELGAAGPVARACPLPEVAAERVGEQHGYHAMEYCARGETERRSFLEHSLPGMTTPKTGRICALVLYPNGGDDTDHFSEDGLRLSIRRFAAAYRARLEWLETRRAALV